MGMAAHGALARSIEPLKLRASFVSTSGDSRALLAGADGQSIYRVGESLPGGSALRRVEPGRVVLWRNGREEFLSLELPATTLKKVKGPASEAPGDTSHLLRVKP
jgi:type II secretory pathway component PulC